MVRRNRGRGDDDFGARLLNGLKHHKVNVDHVTVTEGESEADVRLTASEENFNKIVAGELNPTTAYMTGKLKVKGDMGAAMKLQKLF